MSGPDVQHYTQASVLTGSSSGQITVRLGWRAADPYTVEMAFLTAHPLTDAQPRANQRAKRRSRHHRRRRRRSATGEVRWVLDRDLLADGLGAPAGIGDVHIRPGRRGADYWHDHTVIQLSSPDGQAAFEFTKADLGAFLSATYDQVAAGAESLDLDAELTALLAGQ